MYAESERHAGATGGLVLWGRRLGVILSFVAGWEMLRGVDAFIIALQVRSDLGDLATSLPSAYWELVPIPLWGLGLAVGIALSRVTGARLDNLARQPTPGSWGWKLEHNRTYLVWMRRLCFAVMVGNGAEVVRAIWSLESLMSLVAPGHCREWSSLQTPLMVMLACALGISQIKQSLGQLDRETASP
jgi:hypothetical protein